MEPLVLNKNYESIAIVDVYSSFIWTDRYNTYGDFEISFPMDESLLAFLEQDNYLWIKESEHTMIIEDISIESDIEDGSSLVVTGRSLESILSRRIAWGYKVLTGNLQNAVKTLIMENIISPSNADRRIDNFVFVESDDPKITKLAIDAQYFGEDLYKIISELCIENDIGFKLVLTKDNTLEFSLYAGEDRSYSQSENPYVVFSPGFDNIINSNYYSSKAGYKNVVLVGGEGEANNKKTVSVGSGNGLDRREIYADGRISSRDENGGTLSAAEIESQMKKAGEKILSDNKVSTAFEGEVDTTKPFNYGEDFLMGDIVQLANEYGIEGPAYISELVISSDDTGLTIYPTFKTLS